MGRPTKDLYSMAGLLFIMEFRNWTHEEAADAYMFNIDAQYALNLNPEKQSLCRRTIKRYIKLFRDDELAQAIMHDVSLAAAHGRDVLLRLPIRSGLP